MCRKIILLIILISFTNSSASNPIFEQLNANPCENVNGSGYLPYDEDCSYYIHCYNQRPTVLRCPDGQIFDGTQLRCIYGDSETCEAALPSECPLIDDPYNPVFFPHPEECSKYFMCYNGTAIERECYYGLVWSVDKEWCDYPENVNCDRITTTPLPQQTPRPPFCNEWIVCPREGFGYLPNFSLCHRFVLMKCFRGKKVLTDI